MDYDCNIHAVLWKSHKRHTSDPNVRNVTYILTKKNTFNFTFETQKSFIWALELNAIHFEQNHLALKSIQYLEVEDKSPYRYGVWHHLSQSQLSNWPAKSIMRQLISELAKSIDRFVDWLVDGHSVFCSVVVWLQKHVGLVCFGLCYSLKLKLTKYFCHKARCYEKISCLKWNNDSHVSSRRSFSMQQRDALLLDVFEKLPRSFTLIENASRNFERKEEPLMFR